jgi:hypothetical protein
LGVTLLIFSCQPKEKEKSGPPVYAQKQSDSPAITIPGITNEDFQVIEKGDSTIYLKQFYEGLSGRKIVPDTTQIKTIKAKCKFTFGFLQYLTDDRVAEPLYFSHETRWINLEVTNGEIIIPDFYGNTHTQRLYQALGFKTKSGLEQWFEKHHLSTIKTESLKVQTAFYSQLLANKQAYKDCCPEYIRQAGEFLALDKANLNTLKELGLELYYKELTLDIQAELENGEAMHKVIVER